MPFSSDQRFRAHLVDASVATLLIPVLVSLLWVAFRVTDHIPSDSSATQLMVIRAAVRTPFVFCLTCVFFRAFTAWEDVFKQLARGLQVRTFEQRQDWLRKD
ncbi:MULTISPECIES: hypothetical protein [unclassified Corallococcus]|uniref:hypothetical protein n=1 Tax=unclassified Corallococcus TaxID=2685029 RepID=UPI001A8D2C0A|nr:MULTISPECIES: hypothetical protein [unclassified Corallococcus]MBN9684842.1 hypothetical protein [Corallococcus sp. NCSPR001]WAS83693.1 hypothetical protein O0N60_30825 [Corallococcus sp. NCRR]